MPRRIVLTGATRGLGRALVAEFAALGHTLVGCGRSAELVADLARQFPAPHAFAAVDVADAAAVEAWARGVLAQLGPPDLLVLNAAVMNPLGKLWEIAAGDFDRVIDVNVKGVANGVRAFVPAMVAAGKGVVVGLSSGWGRSTSPGVAPYCASKFAVEGLMRALAQELPPGMAAVPLNPGVIDTEMLRQSWGDGAAGHQTPASWAKKAAPLMLSLGAKQSGRSLTVD